MSAAATCDRKRLRVRVSGAVQGVGFRPYVYGLAMRYGLAGFVINGPEGVLIEVEGHRTSEFIAALPQRGEAGPVIVVTSANLYGEPLLIDNVEALRQLKGVADLVVTHDRDILACADDSVVSVAAGRDQFIRRARGYVPEPIRLARSVPPVLAVGGILKSTVTITRDDQAFVSQHIGDLNTAESIRAFEKTIRHLTSSLGVEPVAVAHDLHPDMASTRFAEANARALVAVQHHHAHAAAVIAEHGHAGPALALVLDGHGFGSDGGNWGGELLLCEETSSQRIGHLAPLQIPVGDRAAREPWRMASAVLHGLGRGNEIGQRFAAQRQAGCLSDLLDQPGGTTTTSAGRLFDAAAALLGIANLQSYDGEAALKLEALVRGTTILEAGWTIEGGVLSLGPLFSRLIADDIDAAGGAGLFHGTLAAACVDWVTRSARTTGINTVVLSGGCFLNAVLADKIPRGCSDAGLTPLVPRRLPPNDGGLSLGQAWIAALKIAQQPPAGQELPDMCLSVPAKIAKIRPNEMALVFIDGVNLEISIALLDELDVGDFVLVHVGYALAKIDPAEAKRTLELLQELGAAKECRS